MNVFWHFFFLLFFFSSLFLRLEPSERVAFTRLEQVYEIFFNNNGHRALFPMLADRTIPLRAPHERIRGKGDDSWGGKGVARRRTPFFFFLEILNI